ncbi:MAG: thioredoxin fold domain-containing protein [Planctomycetaceae bacterium]|nr:thioredoxin fold domain-containing protein [Planctomycetaceae bacterium]
MKKLIRIAAIVIIGLSSVISTAEPNAIMVSDKYPDLALGCLTYAKLAELPAGILVKSDDLTISTSDIAKEIEKNPKEMQEQLKKNEFFLAEQIATLKILTVVAKKYAADSNTDVKNKADKEIIQAYFDNVVKSVSVTDAEVNQFYQENKDACGGATLDAMKEQIKQYVLGQKQQLVVTEHIKTLGKKQTIEVSSSWVGAQAASIKDNPVDKARASGNPSVVDFGATGCRPCDMMTPVLANLKEKYAGKANILFVHVKEEEVLASRYGIQSIPVQVFFDKDGKEVFRHTGFYPQVDIEKKLTEMGVKL